jgi:hypothetical protein
MDDLAIQEKSIDPLVRIIINLKVVNDTKRIHRAKIITFIIKLNLVHGDKAELPHPLLVRGLIGWAVFKGIGIRPMFDQKGMVGVNGEGCRARAQERDLG